MVENQQTPTDVAWGPQTQLAIANFPISGRPVDPRLLRALAQIKAAAAVVNGALVEVSAVDSAMARAIAAVANEVAGGAHLDQFPVDVFQTGSGTSTNMNMNEVVATLAARRLGRAVHPNDHVNASQSSNDVIPSAIRIAAAAGVVDELLPVLQRLARVLRRKSREFATVVKAGRTHLMDATPIMLGAEFGAYATQIESNVARLRECIPRVCELPLGGTAVGTGINAPRQFAPRRSSLGEGDGAAVADGARSFGPASCTGRAGRTVEPSPYGRGVVGEDRQRCAVDGVGASQWVERNRIAGVASRFVDHAGQGESRAVRGRHSGVGASIRQRRRRCVRRITGIVRAQHLPSGHCPQCARVDHVVDECTHENSPSAV